MIACEIPPITDELGRYWEQPSLDDVLIDDNVALMTERTFNQLAEYSTSIPTGKYAGKMWKSQCGRSGDWFLRWYEDDPSNPQRLLIPNRKILILDQKGGA